MHKRTTGLILGSAVLAIGVFSAFAFNKNVKEVRAAVNINDYSSCETAYNNHNASGLLTALRNITAPGSAGSYNQLWSTYNTAYVRADGKIFDYYSSITNYVPGGSAQGANYKKEGDSYNREHSIPKSWWGGSESNQGADPFIVVPTDGYVNNARGNMSFGMVANVEKSFSNTKVGSGSSEFGNTGTVFEPDDSVKGDFARIYYYAIAKYSNSYNWTSGEGSLNFSGSASTNFGLKPYAIKLFSYWSELDPVSEWEQSVNNKIANIQGNRNPFIDHPEYANVLWGNVSGYTTYTHSGEPSGDPTVNSVSVSPSTLSLNLTNKLTGQLTATVSVSNGAAQTVTWTSSNNSVASVNSSGLVTANAVGTATITATSTVNNQKYDSCTVTVSEGGGSGGTSGSQRISASASSSYYESGDICPTGSTELALATCDAFDVEWSKNNGTNNIVYNYDEMRVYANHSFTFTPKSDYSITSIEIAANSSSYASELGAKSLTNCTKTVSGSTVTLTPVDTESAVGFANTNQSRLNYVVVNYESGSSGPSTPTLSSIEVANAPTKTTYTAGEYFDPTGLVITRNYINPSSSDTYTYAEHTSEFSFSPNTSTALTTSHTSVTITFGGKSCSQAITVSAAPITSITASVDKTYYVGETIVASDITVKDNNNDEITNFTFADNNYQFKYEDAASGGALTNKTFNNSITYGNLHCSLTVQVQRKAYVAPAAAVTDTITASDLAATDTQYKNFSNVSKTSGAKYAGNSAKTTGGAIQMRSSNSNSGIVSTQSGGTISSVKITVASGSNDIQVYGKNTAYSSASDLYNTNSQGTLVGSVSSTGTVTFTTGYSYVGIRSRSGAIYISSIEINYGSAETAANVANYIMYEDTNGQCETKLNIAIGYLNNTSASEFELFMNSDGYVLATARTRLYAWAANQGKVISVSNNQITLSSVNIINGIDDIVVGNNTTMILIITISISLTTMVGLVIIKKKKSNH